MTKTAARSGLSPRSAAALALLLGACTGPGLEPPEGNDNLAHTPTVQPPPMSGRPSDGGVPTAARGEETPPGSVQPGPTGPADASTGFGNSADPDEVRDEDAGH